MHCSTTLLAAPGQSAKHFAQPWSLAREARKGYGKVLQRDTNFF